MPSMSHDLTTHRWRTVVEGVAAFIVLASLVGGLAAATTWGLLRVVAALFP